MELQVSLSPICFHWYTEIFNKETPIYSHETINLRILKKSNYKNVDVISLMILYVDVYLIGYFSPYPCS